ncbi:MAG: D-amino-acid transaminase [Gemmatimonadaceae bacterium]|nr:D-amino-acid transaminase [Gemmatimonadaceae bacterium]
MIVYLNGSYLPKADAKLSVEDRGFIFGDGIYEVVRCVDGAIFTGAEHFARMQRGLAGLRIAAPDASVERLEAICLELLARNDLTSGHATVYIEVTRGAAPRTHFFPKSAVPATVYLSASPFTPFAELHRTGAAGITYPDIRWARCDLKTVNLLGNVLAKQAATEAGALEAIFVRDGVVTDGSSTAVFGVIDGVLRTHPLSNYILPSITRAVVLELAAELEIPVREEPILHAELTRLEELFIAATTSDVQPITSLDGRTVGTGAPRAITRRLQAAFNARLAACGALAAR